MSLKFFSKVGWSLNKKTEDVKFEYENDVKFIDPKDIEIQQV